MPRPPHLVREGFARPNGQMAAERTFSHEPRPEGAVARSSLETCFERNSEQCACQLAAVGGGEGVTVAEDIEDVEHGFAGVIPGGTTSADHGQ